MTFTCNRDPVLLTLKKGVRNRWISHHTVIIPIHQKGKVIRIHVNVVVNISWHVRKVSIISFCHWFLDPLCFVLFSHHKNGYAVTPKRSNTRQLNVETLIFLWFPIQVLLIWSTKKAEKTFLRKKNGYFSTILEPHL